LPSGGSMGQRYVLQLLLSKKITKLLITQQQLKLKKNKEKMEKTTSLDDISHWL
jgi:hypothetical protein